MRQIEKIVADYETCKKAWEMGLRAKSVFKYDDDRNIILTNGNYGAYWAANDYFGCDPLYTFGEYFFAPTAEEVPLPTFLDLKDCSRRTLLFFDSYGDPVYYAGSVEKYAAPKGVSESRNEATVRLMTAIGVIRDVPEAKQWYINNGYLKEVE